MIACFKHFWSPTIDPRQQCFVHMVHGGFRLWVPLTHRLRARGWRIGNVFQSIVQKWYPRVSYLELTGLSRLSRTSLCDNSLVSSGTWWVAGYRGHRRFFSVGVLNFYYSNPRHCSGTTAVIPLSSDDDITCQEAEAQEGATSNSGLPAMRWGVSWFVTVVGVLTLSIS